MNQSFKNFEMAKCVLMDRMPFFYHWTTLFTYGEVEGNASVPVMAAVPDLKAGTFKLLVNPAMMRVIPTKGILTAIAKVILEIIRGAYKDRTMEHPLGGIANDLETMERLMYDGFKTVEHPEFPGESLFVTIELAMKYVADIWKDMGQPDKQIDEPKPRQTAEYYLLWLMGALPTPEQFEQRRQELEQQKQDQWDQLSDEEKAALDEMMKQLEDALDKLGLLKQRGAHPEVHLSPEKQALLDYMAASQAQAAMNASGGQGMGSLGGDVTRLIESLKSRLKGWRQRVRKYRGTGGHTAMHYTFARTNKYGGTPGVKYEQESYGIMVVDDSGSMGEAAVAQGVGEAEEAGKHVDLTLIFVDDGPLKEENIYHHFKKRKKRQVKAAGGGGTDMRQIFTYIREGKLRRPSFIVIFTDMLTPFPTKAERMGIRTLWVSTNPNKKLPPGAGEIVYMPPEDQVSATASAYSGF